MSRKQGPRALWWFVPFLLLAVSALLLLVILTFRLTSGLTQDIELSRWTALILTLSLIGSLAAYWWPRRPPASSLAGLTALALAIVTASLGIATYLPCHQGWRMWTAPMGWTLGLFVGAVETSPSPGEACAVVQSPGFTLARTFGLLATFVGAISAAALLGRAPIDRLRVRMGPDVDAVVGLTPASLELVKALVKQPRFAPRREQWIDWRPGLAHRRESPSEPDAPPRQPLLEVRSSPDPQQGNQPAQADTPGWFSTVSYNLTGLRRGDLRRWITRRTKVVVLEPDGQNPLLAEARAAGAIVLNADPGDAAILRGVMTRMLWLRAGLRRVSLRRLFIVSENQQANIDVHQRAVNILRDDLAAHPHDVVPRLIVRIDDHRYARAWRLANLTDTRDAPRSNGEDNRPKANFFSDALSQTDATAEAIVEQFIPAVESTQWRTKKIILIGDDPFALQMLEELAWQQWCRYEVAFAALREVEARISELDARNLWVAPQVADDWKRCKLSRLLRVVSGTNPDATHVTVLRPPTNDPQDGTELIGTLRPDAQYLLSGEDRDVLEVLQALAEDRAGLEESQRLLSARLNRTANTHTDVDALQTVLIAGPKSQERADEWKRLRHPWSLDADSRPELRLFSVKPANGDWEQLARESMQTSDTAVVFVADNPEYRSAAARLAEQHPERFIMVRDDSTIGLEPPIAIGAPYRFGGSLTRRRCEAGASCAPEDSLARLAHQQHRAYLKRWPTLPSPNGAPGKRAAKITNLDWAALPDFFQEDNVRQHRALLGWFVRNGYRWIPASRDSLPAHELISEGELHDLVRNEYHRWSELRSERGWIPVADGSQRNDSLRQHPDLQGEHCISWPFNMELTRQITQRLWAIGLTVEQMRKLQRHGSVTAVRLTEDKTWQTSQGDVLTSLAGDWWVEDEAGDSRGMANSVFRQMHKQVGERSSNTWERTGEVWARQVVRREIVDTPEGTAIATPGMWIIAAPTGQRWPVSDEVKQRGYREITPRASTPQTGS